MLRRLYKSYLLLLGLSIFIACLHAPLPNNTYTAKVNRQRPNVLLITIDTLRADHIGCYGYEKIKTPNIDQLAKEGILFKEAYTPVPITLPSHASILTGVYPPAHGVRNNGNFVLDDRSVTLAEILKNEGYQTGAVIGAYVLDARFGLNQGFDFYDDEIDAQRDDMNQLYVERNAEEVTQSAIMWLNKEREKPFFLWLHYFDPHATYTPPSSFIMEYASLPYDGEIAYTDQQIGVLLQYLRTQGEMENTIIALTADHGEGLGEHGEETHAIFLYDATLHVPLILFSPSAFPEHKEISSLVRTIDIMPTILDLLHIQIPPYIQGETLTTFLSYQGAPSDLILYCETYYPELNHGWSPLEGLRTPEWKYIKSPAPELYNLKVDAKENNNLFDSQRGVAGKIHQEFLDLKAGISENGIEWAQGGPLNEEERQKLMSLGYIWTSPPEFNDGPGPDPKEMVGFLNHLNRAISFFNFHEYSKAEEELTIILAANPYDIFARFALANVYMKSGDTEKALKEYERVASQNQNFMDVHNNLGAVYEKMGQNERAMEEYNLAVTLNPTFAEAYNNRGALYMKMHDLTKAREDFLQAIALNNTFPEALNNMGLSYEKEGNFNKAIEYFLESLRLRPEYGDAANNLGCVYIKIGDYESAKTYLEKIIRIQPDHLEAHNNLGIVHVNLKNYDRAILELEETLLLNPNYTDAYISLGIAHFEKEEYILARKNYERALQLDAKNSQAYINLGILFAAQGEIDKAIEAYQEALAIGPEDLEAHLNIANAYHEKGWTDKEIEIWEQILHLNPELLDAHIGLGMAYVNNGLLYEALPVWQKVTQLAPDDPRGYITLGDLYSQMGWIDHALTNYKKGLQLDFNNIEGHLGLGAIFYQRGDMDSAHQEWQRVLSIDPQNTHAYFNMAAALSQKGLFYEAIKAYNKLIEINPDDTEAHFYLGMVYEQVGKINEAVYEYKEVLRISPDYTQAQMMLQKLEEGGGINYNKMMYGPGSASLNYNVGGF